MFIDDQAVARAQQMPDVASLLALQDVEFVAATYLTLLRRPADADGLEHYTRRLRAGSTKLEILSLVASSREGRSKGGQLPGLARALKRYRLSRLPLLGGLLRFFMNGESHSAKARRQRAIEQHLIRQEAGLGQLKMQLAQQFLALREDLSSGSLSLAGGSQGRASAELLAQPRGQIPSVISRFITLDPGSADEVIAQLAELVGKSLEAKWLSGKR